MGNLHERESVPDFITVTELAGPQTFGRQGMARFFSQRSDSEQLVETVGTIEAKAVDGASRFDKTIQVRVEGDVIGAFHTYQIATLVDFIAGDDTPPLSSDLLAPVVHDVLEHEGSTRLIPVLLHRAMHNGTVRYRAWGWTWPSPPRWPSRERILRTGPKSQVEALEYQDFLDSIAEAVNTENAATGSVDVDLLRPRGETPSASTAIKLNSVINHLKRTGENEQALFYAIQALEIMMTANFPNGPDKHSDSMHVDYYVKQVAVILRKLRHSDSEFELLERHVAMFHLPAHHGLAQRFTKMQSRATARKGGEAPGAPSAAEELSATLKIAEEELRSSRRAGEKRYSEERAKFDSGKWRYEPPRTLLMPPDQVYFVAKLYRKLHRRDDEIALLREFITLTQPGESNPLVRRLAGLEAAK